MTLPDVIVIRGAPGSGKSETAKRLAARLGCGARVEADTLRAMIVPVNWTNQQEHIAVLSLAVGVVAGFLRMGHRPVIVVDTFSGDKLARFIAGLRRLHQDLDLRAFALAPAADALRSRVEGRPPEHFKDIATCLKLNTDTIRHLQSGESLIDNSALSPEETAEAILADCTESSGTRAEE